MVEVDAGGGGLTATGVLSVAVIALAFASPSGGASATVPFNSTVAASASPTASATGAASTSQQTSSVASNPATSAGALGTGFTAAGILASNVVASGAIMPTVIKTGSADTSVSGTGSIEAVATTVATVPMPLDVTGALDTSALLSGMSSPAASSIGETSIAAAISAVSNISISAIGVINPLTEVHATVGTMLETLLVDGVLNTAVTLTAQAVPTGEASGAVAPSINIDSLSGTLCAADCEVYVKTLPDGFASVGVTATGMAGVTATVFGSTMELVTTAVPRGRQIRTARARDIARDSRVRTVVSTRSRMING